MSNAVQLPIPAKLAPLFTAVNKRYRCSHGGRGSAKTRTFALMTAVKAYQSMMNGESGVVLCAREFMNSLEESSMQEVKQAILSVPGWPPTLISARSTSAQSTRALTMSFAVCGTTSTASSRKRAFCCAGLMRLNQSAK